MIQQPFELAIWLGVLGVVLSAGFYGILLLRKWLYNGGEEAERTSDKIYTTAQVERLKEEGLIDQKQYEEMKKEVFEASKRRAAADRRLKEERKRGIFG